MLNQVVERFCSICGFEGSFELADPRASLRESRCPQCNSIRRTRDVVRVLLDYVNMQQTFLINALDKFKDIHILEFNSHGPLHDVLKTLPHYVSICLSPMNEELGKIKQDLRYLTLASGHDTQGFHIVITEDIFQYVEEPWRAFSEIQRILRPNGQHIFTVPLQCGYKTRSRATRNANGEIINECLPLLHDINAENKFVFTDFGDDLQDLLSKNGISCDMAIDVKFYESSQIPYITEQKDLDRYNFFKSRQKLQNYMLYNSMVFKTHAEQQTVVKNDNIRIEFQDFTNTLQVGLCVDSFDANYINGLNINSIRAEQAYFCGKNTWAFDISLTLSTGQPLIFFMIQAYVGDFSTLIFPSMLQNSKYLSDFVEKYLSKYISKFSVKNDPIFWDAEANVMEPTRMIQCFGSLPYNTIMPRLKRFNFVASQVSKNTTQTCLDVGCDSGYGLAYLSQLLPLEGLGISTSSHEVCNAKLAYTKLNWLEQDVNSLFNIDDLQFKHYSIITCFDCIEFIEDAHLAMDFVKKHLHGTGEFFISFVNSDVYALDTHAFKRKYSFLQMRTLLEEHFEQVDYFFQDDIVADLSERFIVKSEENPAARFWIARCKIAREIKRKPCKLSIIMPLYNKFSYTKVAVDNIYATMPDNLSWELILIDNASSDETINYMPKDERTYIHRNMINEGFAKASNQGAMLAKGEILIFLNNDTEVQVGWVEAIVDELSKHASTGLVSGRLLYPDGTIQHAGVVIGGDLLPYHIYRGLDANDPLVLNRQSYPVLTGACLGARSKEFFNIGMFDEAFVNGHEDIDLCIRYRNQGFTCVYRPDCVVIHHESVSEGRMDSRHENVHRTFNKSREWLIQDDFEYKALPIFSEQFHEHKKNIALKVGVFDRKTKGWGDIFFAECFAKELVRKGHTCAIHCLNEWGRDDKDVDIVIHIKGLSYYYPKPWNINIMWMINHPELHTDEELERYDAICVASENYAHVLRQRIAKPVFTLLQATDIDHFSPKQSENLSIIEKEQLKKFDDSYDVVFVGNNYGTGREDIRQIVAGLLPKKGKKLPFELAVWGAGWENILPDGCHKGNYVPWNVLPHLYGRAKIVLNDHHTDMAQYGFINNRTFDVAACAVPQVCDVVQGLDDVLQITQCADAKSTQAAIKKILANTDQYNKIAQSNFEKVKSNFSFAKRADEIYDIIENINSPALLKRVKTKKALAFAPDFNTNGPLVSVLISTYNRRQFLPQAIESIINQKYTNWELCLVCDGGAPVYDIVEQFHDKRILLLHVEKNQGKSKCINAAFAMSRGEYIAYLDDDDIWYPDHLEKNMRALCHMSGFDMSYSNALGLTLDFANPNNIKETYRDLRYDSQVGMIELLEFNQITGISVVHKRHLFEQAGAFDEKLSVLIDYDMWRRLACFSYAYHVSYLTAEYYKRDNMVQNKNITSLFERNILSYLKQRVRILHKKLANGQEEKFALPLNDARERTLFEYLYALCEQALQRKEKDKYIKLLPLVSKYCNSMSTKSKFASFLMKIGYFPQALEYFMHIFPYTKRENHSLFMMLLCAIYLKHPFAYEVYEALHENYPHMLKSEKELFLSYADRLNNAFN